MALQQLLRERQAQLMADWTADLKKTSPRLQSLMSEGELLKQCREFLQLLADAVSTPQESAAWEAVREYLRGISRSRAIQGFTPMETATFVFSAKRALYRALRAGLASDPERMADETWTVTELLDKLGLFTTEVHQASREEIIARQQQELLELSTPVVKLWDGILALPLIGTLDSARTQVVMENLLQSIVSTGASIAIIDITGVPTVDTLVAQHLIKTVTAAKLMGADCIISGIRPQIAQTIVHLGVDLAGIATKSNLADAFSLALTRAGKSLHKPSGSQI